MTTPSSTPIQLKKHTCKQGYSADIVPKLPMISMLVGPSGPCKTMLLTNMTLDIYKGCFHEFVFGVHRLKLIQHGDLLRIISETIPNQMIEKSVFDSYDPSELEQVIKTQQKVIDYQKRKNITICIRYSLLSVILQTTPISHESLNYYINYT